MFKLSADELTEEDIRDALAAVANVIGGSIMGIVDCDCDLTLPCVDDAPTDQNRCTMFNTYQCCGLPVCIAVVEHEIACTRPEN